jgi:hypothetical protein
MRYLKGTATYQLYFQALMESTSFLHIQMQTMLWILTTENPVVGVLFYLTMGPLHS